MLAGKSKRATMAGMWGQRNGLGMTVSRDFGPMRGVSTL